MQSQEPPQNEHQDQCSPEECSRINTCSAYRSHRHDCYENEEIEGETTDFEQNKIQQFQNEQLHIQKKVFTKWCNSYLNKNNLHIDDLFIDFCDGILLMKFLEIISGDKLGTPNRGRMRVQKVENLNTCLNYLKYKKIQLENIGAEDILNQNKVLILGLIWTIMVRFEVENIEIDDEDSGTHKNAKEALLLWCQKKTSGYPNVKIENFTTSWSSGLTFNALIHAYRPDLINFDQLNPNHPIANLNHAFDVAEKQLRITRLLNAEDIDVASPDEKSIITYVSLYCHYLTNQENAEKRNETIGVFKQNNPTDEVETYPKDYEELVPKEEMEIENNVPLDNYNRESQKLESWIDEQLQIAMCEDCAQNYEHFQDSKTKFEEFRENVKVESDRLVQCEKMANDLIIQAEPYAKDILRRQEKLTSVWKLLLDSVKNKGKKLDVAEKFYKFNEDVTEMIDKLEKKKSSMSTELGNDTKQAYNLCLEHEIFYKEALELHEHLQKLIEEGGRLRTEYPGPNAEYANKEMNMLVELWNELRKATTERQELLIFSYNFQRFQVNLRDFISWADHVNAQMKSDNEKVIYELQTAESMAKKHSKLKLDIDAKEGEFVQIHQNITKLFEQKYPEKTEIEDKLNQVHCAYEQVKSEWQFREKHLHQVAQYHKFDVDAKLTIAAITAKENTVKSIEIGSTVEAIESELSQSETFTKDLRELEEKVALLDDTGHHLIQQQYMEVAIIEANLRHIHSALNKCKVHYNDVYCRLQAALKEAKLVEDLKDLDQWVEEKLKRSKIQLHNQLKSLSLDENSENMKYQQALKIEINDNQPKMERVRSYLIQLRTGSSSSGNLDQKVSSVRAKWDELLVISNQLTLALHEGRNLSEFNQMVETLHIWIRDKELFLNDNDMGSDLEHCQSLLDRLTEKDPDQSVDDRTLDFANKLGQELIAKGLDGEDEIHKQLKEVNESWSLLGRKIDVYKNNLEAALLVHQFNKDTGETNTRIHEIVAVLSSDDYGKDTNSVEILLINQDAAEKEISAIHKKLIVHDLKAKELLSSDPPLRETLISSLKTLEGSWKHLVELSFERKQKLERSFDLHKHFDEVKKAESRANEMLNKMKSCIMPRSVVDAKASLASHEKKKVEIANFERELKNLSEYGQTLAVQHPDYRVEINNTHKTLENIVPQIRETWEEEKVTLDKALKLQTFNALMILAELWISSNDALINHYDSEDPTDHMDSIMQKYDASEKNIKSQGEEKMNQLKSYSVILHEMRDSQAEQIRTKYQSVLIAYSKLLENCQLKRKNLENQIERRINLQQIKILQEEHERRKFPEASITSEVSNQERSYNEVVVRTFPKARSRPNSTISNNTTVSTVSQPPTNIQKTHSLRTTSEPVLSNADTSSRTDGTSGTTRAQSNKSNTHTEVNPRVVHIHGYLKKKNDLESGGERATVRSWKQYFAVLCGQLLCFFRDYDAYMNNMAIAPPINIFNARCQVSTKKTNSFVVRTQDRAAYYFVCCGYFSDKKEVNQKLNHQKMIKWVEKIDFYAKLEPKNQLRSYRETSDDFPLHNPSSHPEMSMSNKASEQQPTTSSFRSERQSSVLDSRRSSEANRGSYVSDTWAYMKCEIRSSIDGTECLHQSDSSTFPNCLINSTFKSEGNSEASANESNYFNSEETKDSESSSINTSTWSQISESQERTNMPEYLNPPTISSFEFHYSDDLHHKIYRQLMRIPKFNGIRIFEDPHISEPYFVINDEKIFFEFINMGNPTISQLTKDFEIFECTCPQGCSEGEKRWVCTKCGEFTKLHRLQVGCSCGIKRYNPEFLICLNSDHHKFSQRDETR